MQKLATLNTGIACLPFQLPQSQPVLFRATDDSPELALFRAYNVCKNATNLQSDQTRSSAIAEGPRDASCQLKSCQLPRNSAEITYTTSPDQIDGMKLEI